MKITGTRSYIIVDFGDKAVKIQGELTSAPAFYASLSSIKNWEPPYENSAVTEDEITEITRRVAEENKGNDIKIIFED